MQFFKLLLLGVSALSAPIFAQTWTPCNPLNDTICPVDPALAMSHAFVFNSSSTLTDVFNITAGSLDYDSTNGTAFTVAKKGDSPTIQSQFYIFFGSVSVVMKAATGQGIISSIVLESDDLDEVDWEFMGGNGTHAETNYFGKGNTTSFDRALYYPVSSDPRENFHNYTVHWTSAQIEWYIDSDLVRTLPYTAANEGNNFPQTPMTVRFGIWAGGDADNSNGTIEWAGGLTDYSKGPYTMYLQSAVINDYGTGKAYNYTDHTGSWQSIKSISGNSTIAEAIVKSETPTLSVSQKFNNLPATTKLAVYCGSAGAGALLLFAAIFSCIRARRRGKRERTAYNALIEKQQQDAYRDQMELREKGLGGWNKREFEHQGDDALGGWGGSHIGSGKGVSDLESPTSPAVPANAHVASGQAAFPAQNLSRMNTPAPTMPRINGPVARAQTPTLVSPQPQSASREWNEGSFANQNASTYTNAYSGATRSPSIPQQSRGPSRNPSYGRNQESQAPQQAREFPGSGYSSNNGGRF